MFSGIVEAKARALSCLPSGSVVRVRVARPLSFDDLKPGDSVATDGVCLTVESVDTAAITFALAAETLHVTGWTAETMLGRDFNLERSLRLNDRVHGHCVTGHVDCMGQVVSVADTGETRTLRVLAPSEVRPLVWRKGSWALNGVSLTINAVEDTERGVIIDHCLIPETLKRTNLGALALGSRPTIEVDAMARAFARALETGRSGGEK